MAFVEILVEIIMTWLQGSLPFEGAFTPKRGAYTRSDFSAQGRFILIWITGPPMGFFAF